MHLAFYCATCTRILMTTTTTATSSLSSSTSFWTVWKLTRTCTYYIHQRPVSYCCRISHSFRVLIKQSNNDAIWTETTIPLWALRFKPMVRQRRHNCPGQRQFRSWGQLRLWWVPLQLHRDLAQSRPAHLRPIRPLVKCRGEMSLANWLLDRKCEWASHLKELGHPSRPLTLFSAESPKQLLVGSAHSWIKIFVAREITRLSLQNSSISEILPHCTRFIKPV